MNRFLNMSRRAGLPMIVCLKKNTSVSPVVARFDESIVDSLKMSENTALDGDHAIYVNCNVTDDGLVLSGASPDDELKVLLRRPPFCPIKSLTSEPLDAVLEEDVKARGVNVGVAILVESVDNSVLLTRRAGTMRTFPHVWVPPGGHVEQGETLAEAGMRELEEETGIKLDGESTSLLGLWESSFPVMRHLGTPKRHHVVAYMHCKHSDTAAQINKTMQIETREVDACTWVCTCVASRIASTGGPSEIGNIDSLPPCDSPGSRCVKQQDFIDGVVVGSDNEFRWGKVIPTAPLFAAVGSQRDNERVSTGTKFALKLWMDSVKMRGPGLRGAS